MGARRTSTAPDRYTSDFGSSFDARIVARDERGFILAGPDAREHGWPLTRDPYVLETTVPGVFVAGDVRARSIKRVASAVGEGSMAVSLIHEYLGSA